MFRLYIAAAVIWTSPLVSAHSQPKDDPLLKLLPKPIGVEAKAIHAYSIHVLSMAFANDGKTLLTFGLNRDQMDSVVLWDVESCKRLRAYRAGGNRTQFLASDSEFACFTRDLNDCWGIVKFDVKTGERTVLHVSKYIEQPVVLWPDRSIAVVAIHAEARHDLKFVDYAKKTEALFEIGEPFEVLSFSADTKLVALRCDAGKIKIFDWAKKKRISEFVTADKQAENERIAHWFLTSDNKFAYVAIEGIKNRIEKWDVEQGKLVKTIKDLFLMCAAGYPAVLTPDDGQIVTVNTVIDLKSGKVRPYGFKGKISRATALAITPDGRTCAKGHDNGMIHIFPTPKIE